MALAARNLSAAAVPAPAPAPRPRRQPAAPARVDTPPVRRARRPARPRLGRSLVWVAVIGTLLAGIVALNVAALQLRIERGNVTSDIAKIRAENESLRAELELERAPGRIEAKARSELGLTEAGEPVYVKLRPGKQ